MPFTSPVALVAIIDGHASTRGQVRKALMSLYRVNEYPDGERAVHGLKAAPPALILVDDDIAPEGGPAFVQRLKQIADLATVPVVILSGRPEEESAQIVASCGASGSLTKPFRRSDLIKAVSGRINRKVETDWENLPPRQRAALKGTVAVFNNISDFIANGEPVPFASVKDACAPLIDAVAQNDFKGIMAGVREHDNYSYAHSLRVATLLSLFGHTLGLPQSEQLVLASGGLLHDAGKISIPHEVLNKPGRLSEAEFQVMKSHVTETVKFLDITPDIPRSVIVIAAQHHEKLDGSGYPNGLKGSDLNDLARMASIVDVFSALTDRRIYKPPMPAEKALEIMTHDMGTHLDQHFLALFKAMLLDAVVN